MILSDLLHFSTSHDALISSIQMLLAKLESSRIYVGVSLFTGDLTLPCKLNGITFIRQVLTPELRSATLLSRRVKKQGYRSQKFLMKASKVNGWAIWLSVIWTKRLLEFEKLHVDTGLAAGLQIASNRFNHTYAFPEVQHSCCFLSLDMSTMQYFFYGLRLLRRKLWKHTVSRSAPKFRYRSGLDSLDLRLHLSRQLKCIHLHGLMASWVPKTVFNLKGLPTPFPSHTSSSIFLFWLLVESPSFSPSGSDQFFVEHLRIESCQCRESGKKKRALISNICQWQVY